MTTVQPSLTSTSATARRYLPLVALLFAGTGCSALIYEIVWYQLLQLVIGSSAVSLGVLLATFMGGLCIGSLFMPRLLARRKDHPLLAYALVEAGIGVFGLLVLYLVPLADVVYAAAVGHGMPAILLRAFVCALCLLPPTILMGASLPAAARWIESTPAGVSWMGLLYGANTVGAVCGCLLAGFYLLRVFDMATATFVAVGINAVVALVAFAISKRTPPLAATGGEARAATAGPAPSDWQVYTTIALSGACALGAEVVWTRLLGLLLGATVYTFSIILAVFLVGIAIGSAVASQLARGRLSPRAALGWTQMLLTAAVAWTALMLSDSIPYWPINPLLSTSPWFIFQVDFVRVAWTVLPAALLWGASFPLALAAAAPRSSDSGGMVGRVYAANTGGAIAGALLFSLVFIPWLGTTGCERLLILLAALGGLTMLVPLALKSSSRMALPGLLAVLALAAWMGASVTGVPDMLIAFGRRMVTSASYAKVLYSGEGINSSIAITQWNDNAIQFHVSGKVEASTEPYDMRLQRMLGHLPALVHPNPKSVLIVGFGAGVTAGSFVPYPGIERIVICEMEPLIPGVATKYFGQQNYNVMNDKRVQIVYDDARHYILTSREKFDIITSDPIHPWVKGSATLYSKEYFDLVRQHLNPGGVITQWVPLYESDRDVVKSEVATLFGSFPNGAIFANDNGGSGYDTVLLGQMQPGIDVDQMEQRLYRPEYAKVRDSLREVGFNTYSDLLTTYTNQHAGLKRWLEGAAINRDGSLRLQYLAGMALNISMENTIYQEMRTGRSYPEELFHAGPSNYSLLHSLLSY